MAIILLFFLVNTTLCGDPFQSLLRDVILSVRTAGERFFSNIPLTSNVMYQMDPKTSRTIGSLADSRQWNFQFVTVCPPMISLPNLDGFWQITYISRQTLVGVFAEVEQLIDRVSSGGPAYSPRTIGDLMKTGDLPHCMTLTVLADPFPTPFEYSYGSTLGRRSIIGRLSTIDGRQVSFGFGGDVELRAALIYASPSDDVLVFGDVDALPKCSNIMVVRRNQSFEGRIFSQLVSQGSSPPSNPLIAIPCP